MPTVSREGMIAIVRCDTASEFVAVLDPLDGPFRHTPTLPTFVFRGVPDSRYTLLPSAFRTDTPLLNIGGWADGPRSTDATQAQCELRTFRRFFEIAAKHGVRLPEDSQPLRRQLDEWEYRILGAHRSHPVLWPPVEFFSLVALAQHYGVPTRALDWTWSSLTAAYFATQKAPAEAKEICVWAFSWLAREFDRLSALGDGQARSLVLFTASGADNDNLRAQRGMFMIWVQEITSQDTPFVPITYDALIGTSLHLPGKIPVIFKVTAPRTEAEHVRSMIASAGVTAGSLFPGLWGVARELHEERTQWSSPTPGHMLLMSDVARDIHSEIRSLFKTAG